MSTRTTRHLTRHERRALERRSAAARAASSASPRSAWHSPLVLVTIGAVAVMAVAIAGLLLTTRPMVTSSIGPIVEPPVTGLSAYADGEALGEANAPVVLEVFADYQCPWCARFAREALPGLARTYVATGQLRIEERALAFLGTGTPDESLDAAAAAACAVPTGNYWTFADYLAWNQGGENEGAFSRERLSAMADRIGLDRDAFAACLDDPGTRSEIRERTARAFAAGIRSTPTFVLDGETVSVGSFAELGPMIEARISAATP